MKKILYFIIILIISGLPLTGCKTQGNEPIEKTKVPNEVKLEKFTLYDMDSDYNKITSECIEIESNKSIEYKLDFIVKEISKRRFNNQAIEIVKIEDNIAYINIKEDKNKEWSSKYFQGSTGAMITSYNLTENLLQPEYKGQWIDGLYFTYESKTDISFDHMGEEFFGYIIKRNN